MFELKVDYHIHTSFSDGNLSPCDVVKKFKADEYDEIAITDLNTIAGLNEAIIAAKAIELKVIPGIELSTIYEGNTVSLLGYKFDINNKKLNDILSNYMDLPIEDAIKLINESNGMAVLSNPKGLKFLGDISKKEYYDELDKMLKYLKQIGLKGLECVYPLNTPDEEFKFIELAQKYHLHIIKGSNFCGVK